MKLFLLPIEINEIERGKRVNRGKISAEKRCAYQFGPKMSGTSEDFETEISKAAELLAKSVREVKKLLTELGAETVDDLTFVTREMLENKDVLPIKAAKLTRLWQKESKRERAKLPNEFYSVKYQHPATQAVLPFLVSKENFLRDSGYEQEDWARKLALTVDVKDKPDLTEKLSKMKDWSAARKVFLEEAQSEVFRQEAASRLRSLTCDGRELLEFCRNYRRLYDLAGLGNNDEPEEIKDRENSRDVSDLFNCLRGEIRKQALHLKDERFKPKTVGEALELLQSWIPVMSNQGKRRRESVQDSLKVEQDVNDADIPKKKRVKPQRGPAENVVCFNCQKKGHYKSQCPDLDKN